MEQAKYWIAATALLAASVVGAAPQTPATDAALQALADGAPDRALSDLRQPLAEQPDNPRLRFVQALALADTGRPDEALAIFEALSDQYPQRARLWNNLGVLYARQGRLDQARDSLQRAVTLAPNYADARENLGDVYIALADAAYREAEQNSDAHARLENKRQRLDGLLPFPAAPAAAVEAGANPAVAESTGSAGRKTLPPATEQSPTQARAEDDRLDRQIDQTLSRWARARSARDVSAYLASYSDDYQPAGDLSRAEWIRRQRTRLKTQDSVHVQIDDIRVEREADTRASVTFHERYRSPKSSRDARRHMVFVREDGDWRIVRES